MSTSVAACRRVTAPADDSDGYRRDLENVIAHERVDLVIPVSEETPHVAALASNLDSATVLFATDADAVLRLHDKLAFIRWARDMALPVPMTWRADDDDCRRLTDRRPFVVKPRDACSGTGVRFCPAGTRVSASAGHIVQERLDGRLVSSFTIARRGKAVATSVYEATVLSGSVAVCFERVHDADAVERWVDAFVEGSGHTGFIAFDFFVDDRGVARAIECNPRATSGIHFIRSDTLPALITEGVRAQADIFRDEVILTEAYSCMTAALGLTGSGRASAAWRALRSAHDVTWHSGDPMPFLLMMVNTWRIVWLAATRRLSFAQAAVLDIRWSRDRGSDDDPRG